MFLKNEYILFFITIFLCLYGLLVLYSASSYYCINVYNNGLYLTLRQGVVVLLGLVLLIVISFLPYKMYVNSSLIIYATSFFLVMLTFFIGVASRGSTRWVEINGITFQPSEIMKIGLILYLSNLCNKFFLNQNEYDEVTYKHTMLKIIAIGMVPSLIISISNLSTGIICIIITLFYIYIISKKKLIFILMIGLIVFIFFFKYPVALIIEKMGILKQYQMNRILAWVNPQDYEDLAYQTNQTLYAIGSGGVFGRGIGESLQKLIIPEVHNDMIFSCIAEESGIVGCLFLIFVYMILIGRIFYLAYKNNNISKSLVLCGVGVHIFIQVILNISVCLNLIPNTGVTLPFISYGGTSLLILLIEIGICMAMSK